MYPKTLWASDKSSSSWVSVLKGDILSQSEFSSFTETQIHDFYLRGSSAYQLQNWYSKVLWASDYSSSSRVGVLKGDTLPTWVSAFTKTRSRYLYLRGDLVPINFGTYLVTLKNPNKIASAITYGCWGWTSVLNISVTTWLCRLFISYYKSKVHS